MRIKITAMLIAGALSLPAISMAAGELPKRGMTQDQIRQQYGQPNEMVPPVGKPAISRWVYDDFTVYFEDRFSLHAVEHKRPEPQPQPDAAPAAVATPADELPPIEAVDDGMDTSTAADTTDAADAGDTASTGAASG